MIVERRALFGCPFTSILELVEFSDAEYVFFKGFSSNTCKIVKTSLHSYLVHMILEDCTQICMLMALKYYCVSIKQYVQDFYCVIVDEGAAGLNHSA